jgi:hypothetical protein
VARVALRPAPAPGPWEYQAVKIPLSVDDAAEADQQCWRKIEGTIRRNLAYLGQEGWELDAELDLQSLRHENALKMRSDRYGHAVYESVTIHVKRPLLGHH